MNSLDDGQTSVQGTIDERMVAEMDQAFGYGSDADRMSDDELATDWARHQVAAVAVCPVPAPAVPSKPARTVRPAVAVRGKKFEAVVEVVENGRKTTRRVGRYVSSAVAWNIAEHEARTVIAAG